MKTIRISAVLSVVLAVCFSCAEEIKPQASFEQSDIFSIGTTFEHDIEGCTVDPSFENTCTDWIKLLEDNKADDLIGGGDIIFRGARETTEDTLYIYTNFENTPLRLVAIDINTLKEVSSGNLWSRR